MKYETLDFHNYFDNPESYKEAFSWAGGSQILKTNFGRCLGYILYGLNWKGEIWHLTEAFPHFTDEFDTVHFFNTLSFLGFKPNSVNLLIEQIDDRLLPCVFIPKNQPSNPFILLESKNDNFIVYDSQNDKISTLPKNDFLEGDAYFFTKLDQEDAQETHSVSHIDPDPITWFFSLVGRFKSQIQQGLLLTFMTTLFSIFGSIYIMNIYDKVIYIHAGETIKYILSGILLVIILDYTMRQLRTHIFSWFGTRLTAIISPIIFERILSLPAKLSEAGTVSSQLARISDFQAIQNFFSGPLIITFLEIPFSFLMLITIYILGGELVIIPVTLMIIFIFLSIMLLPLVRRYVEDNAKGNINRYSLTINTINKLRFLKTIGNTKPWFEQLRIASGNGSFASFRISLLNDIIQVTGYSMYVVSGFATMFYGVILVIDEKISAGALIACMLLIWRLLNPLQTCLSSLSVFIHLRKSIVQTHKLLLMKAEELTLKHSAPLPKEPCPISLSDILLRHHNHPLIIFNGLNITINPGELFMIAGRNGSGKTTFLKMLNGLYQPQSGSIRLNNIDIRQFDMSEYRRTIGYVPEKPDLFFGTINQNLSIANPAARHKDIIHTLQKLGCFEDILSYQDGLNHHIEEFKRDELPDTLKYQLCLARAILRDPKLLLIDEAPHNYANSSMSNYLIDYIKSSKGKKTIVMVAKSEELLKLADRVLYLFGDGRAIIAPPKEIINFMNQQSHPDSSGNKAEK